MPPLTVNLPTAAATLGIGRAKLARLVAEGEVETTTIGRRRMVVVDSLHQLVERGAANAR